MKVVVQPYLMSFPNTIESAQVTQRKREGWRICLIDHEQLLGLGEVAPWVGFGSGIEEIKKEIATLTSNHELQRAISSIIEQNKQSNHVVKGLKLKRTVKGRLLFLKSFLEPVLMLLETPEVCFAIELALLDALARNLKTPLSSFLEPKSTLQASSHRLVNSYAEAIEMAQRGYRSVKIKVGKKDHWVEELMEISRIHATLPDLEIRVDANQAWDAELAYGFCIAAKAFGVSWLEEPCCSIGEWQKLKTKLDQISHVSIGLDESISHGDLTFQQCLSDSKVKVVTIKPMFVGGLISAGLMALEAHKKGRKVCVTHSLGSWIERTATTHLVAALQSGMPQLAAGLGGELEGDIFGELAIYGGEIRLSSESGLGQVYNLDFLQSFVRTRREAEQAFLSNNSLHHFENTKQTLLTRSTPEAKLPHPLKQAALARPQHLALQEEELSLSYWQLAQKASFLAHYFESHFTSLSADNKPCTIAISGTLSFDWIATAYALLGEGICLAPIKSSWTAHERDLALKQLQVTYIVHVENSRWELKKVSKTNKDEWHETTLINTSISELGFDHEAMYPLDKLKPWSWTQQLVKVYTSGTTGIPQVISLKTSQICLNAFGSNIRLGHALNDRWLACLPPYHIGGLSTLLRCLFNQTTVYLSVPKAELLLRSLSQVSMASFTPTLLNDIISLLEKGDARPLSDLRVILVGGGPTGQSLWTRAQKYKLPLRLTWGMSEAASQICTQVESTSPNLPLAPMPFAEVEEDQEQRLWVKGPLVKEGQLCSSDLGEVTLSGVKVYGRADDAIISGGINISPYEIEEVLNTHPAISESAVIGIKDSKYGQRPVAYLVQNVLCSRPTDQDLKLWCRQYLSSYKKPDFFIWTDTLPKTALGKVQKHRLRSEVSVLTAQRSPHHHSATTVTDSQTSMMTNLEKAEKNE